MVNKEVSQPLKTEPRFFYGYIVVVIALFVIVLSFGLYNIFGLFFKPLLNEFGWTRAMTSGAFSLSVIINGVLGIVMGGLSDRYGPRVVVTLCGFIMGLGYLLMSQVNTVWQLYLFYGVLIGIGMSGIWVPLLSSVARWFVRKKSLMAGIVAAGIGIGGLIAPPVISRLIAAYDWRLSYIIIGGIVLVFVVLAAQFLKHDPTKIGQLPYGENDGEQRGLKTDTETFALREAVHTMRFWLASIMFFCTGFCATTIMVHFVPHVTELGISFFSAANILAAMGGVSILGSYVLGFTGDRIGNRQVFIIGCSTLTVALFWLLLSREVWMLYLFAVICGFALGMGVAESPLIAGLFGLGSHGLILGVAHLGFNIGCAAGPVVTGYIYDITGSYQVAFLVCVALGVVGLILTLMLRPTRKLDGRI